MRTYQKKESKETRKGRSKYLSYLEVTTYFSDHGCTVLSPEEEFVGYKSRLRFRCPCGNEVETRWAAFKAKQGTTRCLSCAHVNMMETIRQKNGGLYHFQTESFKETVKKDNQDKYGVDVASQSQEVKARAKQTCLTRYGHEYIGQVPEITSRRIRKGDEHWWANPESVEKFRQTMLDRYGVPSLAFVSRRSSLAAQRFFTRLFDMLPAELQEKSYFSPRTHEFNIWFNKEYFKYDFVQSKTRQCIEYNGSKFHPRPEQAEDDIGWCLFRPRLTVKEAREYEARKLGGLIARDFSILVVWDFEVHADAEAVLHRCLEFLQGATPGNWSSPSSSSLSPSSP